MKLKFKKQAYQTLAVEAVADCFAGQPKSGAMQYRIDPGRTVDAGGQAVAPLEQAGFKNADLVFAPPLLLENIHVVQRRQELPLSDALVSNKVCTINLDIEMETGTGKTYCYIKTMFELHQRYGWSKFIVVVPSIAIREGVFKSLEITAEHFLQDYGKRALFHLQLQATAQSRKLFVRRRRQCDGDQRSGVQCDWQGRAAHLRGT